MVKQAKSCLTKLGDPEFASFRFLSSISLLTLPRYAWPPWICRPQLIKDKSELSFTRLFKFRAILNWKIFRCLVWFIFYVSILLFSLTRIMNKSTVQASIMLTANFYLLSNNLSVCPSAWKLVPLLIFYLSIERNYTLHQADAFSQLAAGHQPRKTYNWIPHIPWIDQ